MSPTQAYAVIHSQEKYAILLPKEMPKDRAPKVSKVLRSPADFIAHSSFRDILVQAASTRSELELELDEKRERVLSVTFPASL